MKIVTGTLCVNVKCEVPDALYESRRVDFEKDGLSFDSLLHDFICEAGPAQCFSKKMGPDETDWVEFFCDADVDEGLRHDKPAVEDED